MQTPHGVEGPPSPDRSSQRMPVVVKGFMLMCVATAMTLPAFIWFVGGGLCGGGSTCNGPEDIPPPALVLIWLSVPLGLVALGTLVRAQRKIERSGEELNGQTLVAFGFLLALAGTLIVAYIVFSLVNRVLTEPI